MSLALRHSLRSPPTPCRWMQRVTEFNSAAEVALQEGLLPLCDDPAWDQILATIEHGLVPLPAAPPLPAAVGVDAAAVISPPGPADGDLATLIGDAASAGNDFPAAPASPLLPEDADGKGKRSRQNSPNWEDLGSSSLSSSRPPPSEPPHEGDVGQGISRSRSSWLTPLHTPSKQPCL